MVRVGITGQAGFVGTNLNNYLQSVEGIKTIAFEDSYYEDKAKLCMFASQCDVIVHLAAIMRSQEPGAVYHTNMRLVRGLIEAADRAGAKPSILFSSSIMESDDTEYGRCKREGAALLRNWCKKNGAGFCKLVFPNLFGPYAKPNYSSFIATFCYKLTHGEEPQVLVDRRMPLAYIGDVVGEIYKEIVCTNMHKTRYTREILPQVEIKVTEVLAILQSIRESVIDKGEEPELHSKIERDLYATFKSYM